MWALRRRQGRQTDAYKHNRKRVTRHASSPYSDLKFIRSPATAGIAIARHTCVVLGGILILGGRRQLFYTGCQDSYQRFFSRSSTGRVPCVLFASTCPVVPWIRVNSRLMHFCHSEYREESFCSWLLAF